MKTRPSAARYLAIAFACALVFGLLLTAGAFAQSPVDDEAGAASPSAVPAEIQALRLNEFMASNKAVLEDPDEPGEFPDWIELYNPGNDAVNIKGVAFSDDLANPARSPITGNLFIPAKGFLLFYADNDPKQGLQHLNFALSAGGETLGLYWAATNEEIDFYEFAAQDPDVSEGRKPDGSGAWQKMSVPTPGQSNQLEPPVISNVQRSIVQPQAGQTVDVTAQVTDNEAGFSVRLAYSTTSTSLQEIVMTPQGGNLFKATLPAHANGVHVAYRVRALDADANAAESPRDGYVVGYVKPVLFINEFVAENTYVEGNQGNVRDPDEGNPGDPMTWEYPDWMEIYNPGDQPVSLNGLSLTDNHAESTKYRIPNGLTIAPKGHMIFWLDNDPEQGPNHATFALKKDGDTIALYGGEGSVRIDGVDFGKQSDNVATGRYPDGGPLRLLYFLTPGAPNTILEQNAYLPAGKRGQ